MHAVHEATARDRLAIERLYAEAIGSAAWLPPQARRRVKFAEVSQGEVVYVVKAGTGELAGFISVYAPESFVHHLFVASQFQRQGLASSLLTSLHTWLPLPWRLKCVQGNTDALSFYAAKGWQAVSAGESEDGQYSVLDFSQEPNPSMSGRAKGRFAPFGPPIMSNVRPHKYTVQRSRFCGPTRISPPSRRVHRGVRCPRSRISP